MISVESVTTQKWFVKRMIKMNDILNIRSLTYIIYISLYIE